MDPPPRRSKQQASKNISSQNKKRPRDEDYDNELSSSSSMLPASIYGVAEQSENVDIPSVVMSRDLIRNALINTVSEMYFGTTDPFPEILRCLDDRIDPHTHRYVSGLMSLMKSEIQDMNSNKKASKEKIIVTPLDMLACPFRKPQIIDSWTPFDVALFELGICERKGYEPKKMHALFEGRKSMEELDEYMEHVYSFSDNFAQLFRTISNDFVTSEEENEYDSQQVSSRSSVTEDATVENNNNS